MEDQENNKGQNAIWVGNRIVKHRGIAKHHVAMMHQERVAK
jgi:hypothetical protein